MKNVFKFVMPGIAVLALGGVVVASQYARPEEHFSDLTLANIEAMSLQIEYGNIASCPWPADPYVVCWEITHFPDGEVVSVPLKG